MSRVQAIAHRLIAGIDPKDQRAGESAALPSEARLAA
jgi:hypothetical protein